MKLHGFFLLSLLFVSSTYAQTASTPTVQFGNQDSKVVYVDVENNFCFTVKNVAANKITLEAEGAQLKNKGNGLFSIKPTKSGIVKVVAYAEINKKKTQTGSVTLTAQRLPDPTPMLMIGGDQIKKSGANITKDELLNTAKIICSNTTGLDSPCSIISFTMVAKGQSPLTVKGADLDVNFINKMSADDMLVIKDLVVVGADKTHKNLNTLVFILK